jgi:hypothetical protein
MINLSYFSPIFVQVSGRKNVGHKKGVIRKMQMPSKQTEILCSSIL